MHMPFLGGYGKGGIRVWVVVWGGLFLNNKFCERFSLLFVFCWGGLAAPVMMQTWAQTLYGNIRVGGWGWVAVL